MTISDAVTAARNNTPVIYEDALLGPMLYARIGAIRKTFALREAVAAGKAEETYGLELLPMNGARSVMVVDPERVRAATPEELMNYKLYGNENRTDRR